VAKRAHTQGDSPRATMGQSAIALPFSNFSIIIRSVITNHTLLSNMTVVVKLANYV